MRNPLLVLLIVLSTLLTPAWTLPVRALAPGDPSELFLNAYMSVQQAEKLQRDGSYQAALAKYRNAGTLLDQIRERSPDWQPLIVEYRKKKTGDAIASLQQKIELEAASRPPAGTPPLDTDPLPSASAPAAQSPASGGDIIDQIRTQMATLKKQLQQSREELTSVQGDKERLATKLNEVTTQLSQAKQQAGKLKTVETDAAEARESAAVTQAQLAKSQQNEAALKAELEKIKTVAAQASAKVERAESGASELKAQLQKAQAELQKAQAGSNEKVEQQLADLRNALEDAKAEKEVAEEQGTLLAQKVALLAARPDLSAKLADAEAKIIAMAQERDAMAKQRDSALEQLAQAKAEAGKVGQLLADNKNLTKQLDEAQKTIATLNGAAGSIPLKDQEIAALKQKVASIQEQLATAQKESTAGQTRIAELQEQLDKTVAEAKKTGAESKKLTEENELLRGIVLRELKEQARREQSRKLVMGELERLQIRSQLLNDQVDLLSQPVAKLSDKERGLFKMPQMEIVDNNTNAMAISITAPQAELPAATGTNGSSNPQSSPVPFAAATPKDTAPKAAETLPAELQSLAKTAKEQFERGQYAEAEQTYEKIVSQAPNNLYALSNLGVVRLRADKPQLAEEALKKVLAIAPDDYFAASTLGILYCQQDRYDEAINYLGRSLLSKPKNAVTHNYLGVASGKKGWTRAAQKEFQTALQLDPSYAEAHFNYAVVLATTQPPDKESARTHYKKAVELGADANPGLEEILR